MVTSSGTSVTVDVSERGSEQALADAVHAAAGAMVATLATGASHRSREQWVAFAGECQSLINVVTAAQDLAVAEVARREGIWNEDGTLGEHVHGPGAVTLDAADLVAPALGASHDQAERRVHQAVRLAAGRAPVEVDRGEVAPPSGLGGLHAAMADGRLDGYRAGVVAYELEGAPAEVADAVVAALAGHLAEDGPRMRLRVRRLLTRISPDLLRQRAVRARASTGLRRWVAEPGVDAWFGTFPSEEAATAWAAVDRLAHQYVADGTCSSVEQARGRALTDLVTGNATVDVQVVVTVPADACDPEAIAPSADASVTDAALASPDACAGDPAPEAAPHSAEFRRSTPGGDACVTSAAEVDRHDERGEDLVEAQGVRPSEPMLVRRAWLLGHLAKATKGSKGGTGRRRHAKRAASPFAPCDPVTGARLDAGEALATDAYRAGAQLAALVRARDGRCRFPGCAVAARFCDLDHVRPWPTGPTAARNLLCLCRRHHRIKQSPGWVLRLADDGTATWTDPAGGVRTTAPLNALNAVVLRLEPAGATSQHTPGHAAETLRPWSALETRLELLIDHQSSHRRCTSAAALRAAGRTVDRLHRARAPVHDPPPF